LGQLLDDLIAFARSDGEAQTFAPHRLLLDDIVATVVEEGEALAEPREVGIELTLPEKGVWVDADIRRLKQALIIGLDNAINHSPPGSVIAVGLERSGDRASITIADNGTGLLEADASRVFERFYRGGQAGNSFGLGIGLAIAKAIVEQHNGSIALANRPEGGALLRIELPVPREARP
jgi:signal transduction histidine kinase